MLQENLQINIGANTQDLQAGLNQATNSVTNFSNSVQKASKPTADATNALGNLSRVAQDAPYGFMGIANNLNPLLESFQRLQKESGGAGNALKAMVAGLTGPAGIGLALGVVSSLIVKYGDEIGDLIVKTTDFEKAQEGIRTAFFDSLKAVETTIATDNALLSVINDVTQSTEARKKALAELKETHKGNIELQKADISDGALLIQIIDGLSEALIRKAKIEATAKIIGEEQAKLVKLEMSTIKEQVDNLSLLTKTWDVLSGSVKGALNGTGAMGIGLNLVNDGLKNNEKQVTNTKDSIDKLKESLNKLTGEAYKAGDFNVVGKGGKPSGAAATTENKDEKQVASIIQKLREAESSLDYQLSQGKIGEVSKNDKDKGSYFTQKIDAISDAIKKLASLTSGEAKKALSELEGELSKTKVADIGKRMERRDAGIEGAMSERQLDPVKTERNLALMEKDTKLNQGKADKNTTKELDKDLKQAQKTAEKFADTLSTNITGGLMSMWDAMESGENPLQALGNFFKDLLKQLAAAVVQAIIFQTIMSALGMGGVAGGAGGGGGLIGGISKIFGFAEGGIVSRPTVAMVGEGGQSEAIMPLNKLGNMMNSTFNAGAMSGQGGGGGNGQFVLKGNDLVLAMQRSNFSLNVRR
jgi:hypothetical protein